VVVWLDEPNIVDRIEIGLRRDEMQPFSVLLFSPVHEWHDGNWHCPDTWIRFFRMRFYRLEGNQVIALTCHLQHLVWRLKVAP